MKSKNIKYCLLILIIFGSTTLINAQPPSGSWVISPQVHPDKTVTFQYLTPYTATQEFRGNFTNWSLDAEKINKHLKLVTISVDTDDFLYESVKQNIAMFREKNITVKDYIVDGGHTWMNCKLYLATTLQ